MDHRIRNAVKAHYEQHVYPHFPLLASVRMCDTYALNLDALWARFNGGHLPKDRRILLAGCGSFTPYPTAVANPHAQITALDLSRSSLRRARLHTGLHGLFNVRFVTGEIVQFSRETEDRFHFIDCYGVLHHIKDALGALKALQTLLAPGAVLRLMVYSRCARRKDEAIRAAFRMLDVRTVEQIRLLHRRAKVGSRFKQYIDTTPEARSATGLADMFLHPFAKTYTIDGLLALLDAAGYEPLLFTHEGALPTVLEERDRLRTLERERTLTHNFVVYVGRREEPLRAAWENTRAAGNTLLTINPVIQRALPKWPWQSIQPAPKLGFTNPRIDRAACRLLSAFNKPIHSGSLPDETRVLLEDYLRALFVLETAAPTQ